MLFICPQQCYSFVHNNAPSQKIEDNRKAVGEGELVLSEEPLFTIRAEDHDSDLDQCLEKALEV